MVKTIPTLKFEQPIGEFYLTSIPAEELIKIVEVRRRKFNSEMNASEGGPQRPESLSRISEIAEFCNDPDATFPTPIIISVFNGDMVGNDFNYDEDSIIGHVLDGQHRIAGLKRYFNNTELKSKNFDIPVVLMFGLSDKDEGYVFSIINSKQQKVSLSHVYDIYGNLDKYHPTVVASRITKALNRTESSPFYRTIKMLGRKSNNNSKTNFDAGYCDIPKEFLIEESITQAAIVAGILKLIDRTGNLDALARMASSDNFSEDLSSYDETHPFRKYFFDKENGEKIIFKIMSNCFNGVKQTFPLEWVNPKNYILSKAIGYDAIIIALPKIIKKGRAMGKLDTPFFASYFSEIKRLHQDIELTSEKYSSSNQDKKKLSILFSPQEP